MKSNHQDYKINYNEIYVLVVKIIYFKMIFGKAVKKDLEIKQLNMIIAFLNSRIVDRLLIYIE